MNRTRTPSRLLELKFKGKKKDYPEQQKFGQALEERKVLARSRN
jgi:hypothetical protein